MKATTMNACNFELILVLGTFCVSFQEQSGPMSRGRAIKRREFHREAYFVQRRLSVLSVPSSKILSTASENTGLDCTLKCLKIASCISFNYGIHSKLCQLLSTDEYDSPEKFRQSQEFDHYSTATLCMQQSCKERDSRCLPVFNSAHDSCAMPAIKYFPADFAQSCDDQCKSRNLQCVSSGAFPNNTAVEILQELFGITCQYITSYLHSDQPCYAPGLGICYGVKNIPNNIDCTAGHNSAVRRVCPCVQ